MPKVIKPDYYDTFTCIAGECSITCCQEWKIELDEATYEKWDKKKVFNSKEKYLNHFVEEEERVIHLDRQRRCPFLNKQKLCSLVLEYGDSILSQTCAMFPREIQDFPDRKECCLAPCCPAVIDILRKQDKIQFTGDINEIEDEYFKMRMYFISLIQDEKLPVSRGLMIIFYLILDFQDKKESWENYKLEIVPKEFNHAIDEMEFSSFDTFMERNELFLDLIENYRKENMYKNYLEETSLLADQISKAGGLEKLSEKLEEFRVQIFSYHKLFRNYLASELFGSSLVPGIDLETMTVLYQWISIEYGEILHLIFLRWVTEGMKKISYEMIRDSIVIISRMTGYDEEGICEYMRNAFHRMQWDWGYFALIVGDGDWRRS